MSNALAISKTLPTYRLEALDALLKKLSKKAAKLGVAPPSYKVTATEVKDIGGEDAPELVEYSTVEISYEVIRKVGEWTFLAKIESADMVDGVPRNKVSGINLSEEHAKRFITAPSCCEHCGINRKRNATYMVQDCNDKTLQVGSTCLQDFLGVDPAAAVNGIEYANLISEIGNDEERWGGRGAPRVFALVDVAAAALSLISKNGFVSAADAEYGNAVKTGNDMLTLLLKSNPRLSDWYAKMEPTAENRAAAAVIVDRLTNRILPDYKANPAALDSFSFKLGIILNRNCADYKDMQLFAASVNREAGMIAKASVKNTVKNEWLPGATEGGKIAVKATISMVKEVNSAFGSSLLVKFVSVDGFPLTTFYSGNACEFNPGATVLLKGTVKRLEDGKFGKQTMLTRVKVEACA
jgi:hypothetical protein